MGTMIKYCYYDYHYNYYYDHNYHYYDNAAADDYYY